MKNKKNETEKAPELDPELEEIVLKNAIWTCTAFGFSPDYALKYINSGILGYKADKEGKPILKNGEKQPKTISRASYFRYKGQYEELPQVFEDLKYRASQGYSKLIMAFQEELASLHKFSAENLLAIESPIERQQVISSMVKDVIPTQIAFADMLKKLVDSKKIEEPKSAEHPIHTA